ncbi:hypothetical protein [Burkholderia ubonensis]|uniref:hypothetical protein n=2 Tax=Burkholderia ubonensis TaxID=101571 RepID=UPI0007543977|nr:hypothetical protein [Burkholderia ubonensis]KVD52082.1 hypothetical protein WI86_13595 [Burkholderia ubonensis]KWC56551.1 hypothetical protein WL53_16400 [Burkholderia ubonensis]
MSTFMGMKIFVDPIFDDCQRMQVSDRFAELMPEQFVIDLNGWMREFFGTESRMVQVGNEALLIGPKGYEALKQEFAENWTGVSA